MKAHTLRRRPVLRPASWRRGLARAAVLAGGVVLAATAPLAGQARAGQDGELVEVPAGDFDGVTTAAVLRPGVTYTLEVTGTYRWGPDPTRRADAECSTDGLAVAWQPDRGGEPFLDLLVDGQAVDWAPATVGVLGCDGAAHRYRLAWTPHQTGPLALRVAGDPATQEGYTGALTVTVSGPVDPPAPAPGAPVPPAPVSPAPAVLPSTVERPAPRTPAEAPPAPSGDGPGMAALADLFGAPPPPPAVPPASAGDGTTAFVPAGTASGGGAALALASLAAVAAVAPAAAAVPRLARRRAAAPPEPVPAPVPVHSFEQSFFAPAAGLDEQGCPCPSCRRRASHPEGGVPR